MQRRHFSATAAMGFALACGLTALPALAQTKWDLAAAYPATNFHTANLMQFASDVDQATAGQFKITVHANADHAVSAALRVPAAEIYAIDVSFPELKDKAEFDYLNQQPTSFVLPPEAVDRLRAAAGTIILASPEFQRLLKDIGAKIVEPPAGQRAP